ncbi:hypothetical protein BH10PSE11_BH10PSE11_28510 [soil metagenome]
MRTPLARLKIAVMIAMLSMAIGSGRSNAANLGEACGGAAGITCNSALWCQRADGQCKAADAAGQCNKAPAFCMQIHRPVCGCNGKTYPNDCERQKAKVQLDHVGACPKEQTEPGAKETKPKKSKARKKPAT